MIKQENSTTDAHLALLLLPGMSSLKSQHTHPWMCAIYYLLRHKRVVLLVVPDTEFLTVKELTLRF